MAQTVSVPTLYHTKWHPSSVPLNVIKELDIPEDKFMIKTITDDEMKHGEEFGKVSPRRVNPVLVLPDGSTLLETGAITMFLLERFDKDGELHPLSWDERRPKFLQGMFYAATDAFQKTFEMYRVTKMVTERDEEKIAEVKKDIESILIDHLEKELSCGEKDFYLGNEYSAVDMMFAYLLMCLEYVEMDLSSQVVKDYYGRLQAKEAFKLAYTPTEEEKKKAEEEARAQEEQKKKKKAEESVGVGVQNGGEQHAG